MSTEYKLGAAAVGLIVLLGTIVMFANQPKDEKSGLPFDKGGAAAPKNAGAKPTGDKTVSSPSTGAGGGTAKPSAPTIPAAKSSNPPNRPGGTLIESPVGPKKPDETLPPVVATAPPARRTTPETSGDAPSKTPGTGGPTGSATPPTGTGSGSPTNPAAGSSTAGGSGPGLTPPTSNAPIGSTPTTGEPVRPTQPSSPGGAVTSGETSNAGSTTGTVSPPRSDPPKPTVTGKPTVYDTEIERPSSPVGDLAGRSPGGARSTGNETRSPTAGDRPLMPSGSEPKPLAGKPYKVQHGDRLSVIAKEKYGDANLVSLIKQANPGLNEHRIIAGSTIMLPDPPAGGADPGAKSERPGKPESGTASAEKDKPSASGTRREASARLASDESKPEFVDRTRTSANGESYTVRRNDTLRKIAKARLGDENRWREILALNKDKLHSGDALEIGMSLRMPAAEKAPEKPAENKPRTGTP